MTEYHHHFGPQRPNFSIFIVDEQRYPTVYENNLLKDWRKKNLKRKNY